MGRIFGHEDRELSVVLRTVAWKAQPSSSERRGSTGEPGGLRVPLAVPMRTEEVILAKRILPNTISSSQR